MEYAVYCHSCKRQLANRLNKDSMLNLRVEHYETTGHKDTEWIKDLGDNTEADEEPSKPTIRDEAFDQARAYWAKPDVVAITKSGFGEYRQYSVFADSYEMAVEIVRRLRIPNS